MTIEYRDAVVAITGAGGGIGRELALLLGRRGARLVLSGRRQERLEAVRDEVAAAGARSEALMVAPCDVTDTEQVADVGGIDSTENGRHRRPHQQRWQGGIRALPRGRRQQP